MSVEVVMPQMGESITEGTVSKWLKQIGERVEKDENILEISTDKVDAEVPSPGAGRSARNQSAGKAKPSKSVRSSPSLGKKVHRVRRSYRVRRVRELKKKFRTRRRLSKKLKPNRLPNKPQPFQ